ncbi:MAG: hypothetical protein ACUZ8E_03070 [Candidatus Anammoxibacter sp.]
MKTFLAKLSKLVYSKTFWVNFLMAAGIMIPHLAQAPNWQLSPELTSSIVLFVNIILRFITNKPLEDK